VALDLVIFVLGVGLSVWAQLIALRARPAGRVGWRLDGPYPRRYYLAQFGGVVLWVYGGSGLKDRFGFWVLPASVAVVVAACWATVFVHKRAVARHPQRAAIEEVGT